MHYLSVVIIVCFLAFSPTVTASDRLPAVSDKVHSGNGGSSSSSKSSSYNYEPDDEDFWDGLTSDFFEALFALMIVGSYAISEAQYDEYPYDLHEKLEQKQTPEKTKSDYTPEREYQKSSDTRWHLNGDVTLLTGLDEDVFWYGGQARLHSGGFGLRTGWLQFREDLSDGSSFSSDLIDIMGLYRFYESRHWHLEFGLGGLAYHDRVGTEWGATASIGTDLFIIEPLALHAVYSGGSINDVTIGQGALGIGYLWRHWEARLGYRWTRLIRSL